MSASGCSSWASPQARLGDNRRSPQAKRWGCEKRHGGWNLDDQVAAMWPTPSASLTNDDEGPETFRARQEALKAKGISGNGAGMPLTVAVKDWPEGNARPLNEIAEAWGTPSTMDARGRSYTRDGGRKGQERAAPNGQDESFPSTLQAPASASTGAPSSPSTRTSLRLSPDFVEWLMGWPCGWTIPAPGSGPRAPTGSEQPATGWSLWLRQQHTWLSTLSWSFEPEPEAEPEMRQLELI